MSATTTVTDCFSETSSYGKEEPLYPSVKPNAVASHVVSPRPSPYQGSPEVEPPAPPPYAQVVDFVPGAANAEHPQKSICVAYLLCIFLGVFGAHHQYLGRHRWGFAMMFSLGFLGMGWVVDLVRLPWLVAQVNRDGVRGSMHVDSLDLLQVWAGTGLIGGHYFYCGNRRKGALYLCTLGLLGVGWISDLFRLSELGKASNAKADAEMERIRGGRLTPELTSNNWLEPDKNFSRATAYQLWLPLGWLGAHHFYLRRWGMGTLYFFTLGLFGIGWLTDALRLPSLVDTANRQHNEQYTECDDTKCCNWLHRGQFETATALQLWFPFGFLGLHHFYLRRFGHGLLYFCTLGLFGIGWLTDAWRMRQLVAQANQLHDVHVHCCQHCSIRHRHGKTGLFGTKIEKNTAYQMWCPPMGLLGGHHFYLGRPGFGVLYMLTLGLFGVGWLTDLCYLPTLVRQAKQRQEQRGQRPARAKRAYGCVTCQQVLMDETTAEEIEAQRPLVVAKAPDRKQLFIAYQLWMPFGLLGFHHFYLGRKRMGCLYMFTLGLLGVGWLYDACRMRRLVREANEQLEQGSPEDADHPDGADGPPRAPAQAPAARCTCHGQLQDGQLSCSVHGTFSLSQKRAQAYNPAYVAHTPPGRVVNVSPEQLDHIPAAIVVR